jgi:hypothetical protein
MAKVTKEEFEAMRTEMKDLSKDLINKNGAYGKVDRIYSFILLHDDSCALIFSPEKDSRSRIGALVLNRELFMAGPTRCRMAGEYAVECYNELFDQLEEARGRLEEIGDRNLLINDDEDDDAEEETKETAE